MALVKCNPQNTMLFLFFQTNPSLFVTVTAEGSDGLTVNISHESSKRGIVCMVEIMLAIELQKLW